MGVQLELEDCSSDNTITNMKKRWLTPCCIISLANAYGHSDVGNFFILKEPSCEALGLCVNLDTPGTPTVLRYAYI